MFVRQQLGAVALAIIMLVLGQVIGWLVGSL